MIGAPWIRVHANIGSRPVVDRAAESLGVSAAAAIGHLVQFWGQVSQHAPNGAVGQFSDRQLDAWGGWLGKRGKFAAFIRQHHLDADGRVREWDDYHGPLERQRAAVRERVKRHRNALHNALANGSETHPVTQNGALPNGNTRRYDSIVSNTHTRKQAARVEARAPAAPENSDPVRESNQAELDAVNRARVARGEPPKSYAEVYGA